MSEGSNSGGPSRPQAKITVGDPSTMVSLLGSADEHLRFIERAIKADVHVRGDTITLTGAPKDIAEAERLFYELIAVIERGEAVTVDVVRRISGMLAEGATESPSEVMTQNIVSRRGRNIRPKTVGQKRYVDAIDTHTIVFGIGPAGTGKTYLAMAKAVQALQAKQINRIILTRPAVEAGERLGFLPGTLFEKIDPYLRPLYDALHDMLDPDSIPKLMESGAIEVAPLAYMRGRAMPLDTNVLTPDGFRSIGELEVGDLVVGSNGKPTPVLGVYPQGPKPIYRVYTQDGASVLCSDEHLWAVKTASDKRRDKPWRVLETQEMVDKVWAGHTRRYELPILTEPVEFPEREIPLDPYALGLLLGDGCITGKGTPSFATDDPELVESLESLIPGIRARHRGGPNYLLNRVERSGGVTTVTHPIKEAVRNLGMAGSRSYSKIVPDEYLHNSSKVRLAVLQGLLDSDGGPVTQKDRTCRIQYSTVSAMLKDDVITLAQSLGGVAYVRKRALVGKPPHVVKGSEVHHRHDAYVVDIRLPEGIEPFRLKRKRDKYRASGGGGRPMRFIDRIEPAGTEECVCIQVAAEDSLYVTEDFLLTHNTLNDAFIILDEAQNTTAEQMKMFLTRLGFGSKVVVTGDITQVDLPGGARSGLRIVREILEGVDDLHFSTLGSADVVRHQLVADIVDAYEKWDAGQRENGTPESGRKPSRRR